MSNKNFQLLAGTWKPTSARLRGIDFADAMHTMELIIAADNYAVVISGESDKGKISLDAEQNPHTMDLIGTSGPNKGRKIPAIYEVSGNSLTVCYNLTGAIRPTIFTSTSDNGFFLVKYKKIL